MALNLRERFGRKGPASQLLLADDFQFSTAAYPSLREFQVAHDDVGVLETPLAIDRRYFLTHGSDSLQLELALCLAGVAAAVDLLFERASAFQREPAEDAIVDLATANSIGEVGLAWPWGKGERNGVAGFVRHNVLVFLQGRYETLLEHGKALDAALARAATTKEYSDSSVVLLAISGEGALTVTPGGRVDLGLPTSSDARHFFLATGGSVNRDANEPIRYYYRAGLEKGTYVITALRVGAGLLPARQTIRVTIS